MSRAREDCDVGGVREFVDMRTDTMPAVVVTGAGRIRIKQVALPQAGARGGPAAAGGLWRLRVQPDALVGPGVDAIPHGGGRSGA